MKKGFSLVELSIVIIIIGLLFVGVSAGSSLIQQAKLRTIMNEMRMIETAIKTFVVAYNDLPGDMPNAYDIWGDDCGPNSLAGAGCNGNDNGVIGATRSFIGMDPKNTERYRFWQHMSLAEVIDGSFTGLGNNNCMASSTVPCHDSDNSFESKFSDDLLFVLMDFGYAASSMPESWNTVNIFKIDRNSSGYTFNDSGGAFTAQDLYNIDKKLDDGKGISGSIQGRKAQKSSSSSSQICYDSTSFDYLISDNTKDCNIFWIDKSLFN